MWSFARARRSGTWSPARSCSSSYDAVFLGVGLGGDARLGVPGEEGPGVVFATAWIERMKLALAREREAHAPRGRVVVVGGGNTAIDVARECVQLGAAEVTLVYRRRLEDMSAYAHEVAAALARRASRSFRLARRSPSCGAPTARCALSESRARKLEKPIVGSEVEVPCELVVVAIGQAKLRAESSGEFLWASSSIRKGRTVADPHTGATGHPKGLQWWRLRERRQRGRPRGRITETSRATFPADGQRASRLLPPRPLAGSDRGFEYSISVGSRGPNPVLARVRSAREYRRASDGARSMPVGAAPYGRRSVSRSSTRRAGSVESISGSAR